jgi:soluble lytic murein transglycosylase-like protein
MRFCSIIAVGSLFAGSMLAADAPEQPRRSTSVVRSDPRTGRLVRSVIVTPKSVGEKQVAARVVAAREISAPVPTAAVEPPTGIDEAVEQIAAKHSLQADLLHSVIKVESNYNPYAVSSKGALGMMQLIPATARRFGVDNVFNPVENIEGGARYLRYLLDLYNGDSRLALAAYNAGEAAVAKYGGVPPYAETQNYLILVRKQWEKQKFAARKPQPAPPVVKAAEPRDPNAPHPIQEIVETDGTVRYVSR